jgi:hypothetical protein
MPLKHPKELGFKLAYKILIDEPAQLVEETPEASANRDVVYIALLNDEPLEKGSALKVGQSNNLKVRWREIIGIFGRAGLQNNEREDRRRWLEVARGKKIAVWVEPAGQIEIPWARGLTESTFSTRCAEEEFLDQYYEPKLGQRIGSHKHAPAKSQ